MESNMTGEKMIGKNEKKYVPCSKEVVENVWRNLMGESRVRGKIEKAVQIYGKEERSVVSGRTTLEFSRGQNENGAVMWKSLDQGCYVRLPVDKMEMVGMEKDLKTDKTLAIVFKGRGEMTKGGNIKRTVWRFSP